MLPPINEAEEDEETEEDEGGRKSTSRLADAGGPGSTSALPTSVSMSRQSLGGLSTHSRAVSMSMEALGGTSDDEGSHGHGHMHHEPAIQTVCLRCEQPVALEK